MRISDWSSDWCSSDLHAREHPYHYPVLHVLQERRADRAARGTGGFVRRRARGTLTPTLLDRTEDRPWPKHKPPETPTPTSCRTTAAGRCSPDRKSSV